MKKTLRQFSVPVLLLFCLAVFCLFVPEVQALYAEVRTLYNIDCYPANYNVIYSQETHSGLHGDGKSFYHFQFFNQDVEKLIRSSPQWHCRPIPSRLLQLIQNEHFSFVSSSDISCWLFQEKNKPSEIMDDSQIESALSGPALNCIIAVYTPASNRIYYMAIDT